MHPVERNEMMPEAAHCRFWSRAACCTAVERRELYAQSRQCPDVLDVRRDEGLPLLCGTKKRDVGTGRHGNLRLSVGYPPGNQDLAIVAQAVTRASFCEM